VTGTWNGGVGIWVRQALATRWRGWIALALLAGITGGLGIAAAAGARRTDTAYARFREATGRSDVILFPTQAGVFASDFSAVRALPEVEEAGAFHLAPIGLKEYPMVGSLPGDGRLYRTINRPLVVAGRLPVAVDEILINRLAAERTGLSVGDAVTIVSSNDIEAFFSGAGLVGGPTVRATVVGIGDSQMDLVFLSDEPGFTPSPAFLEAYPEIPRAGNLVVRLRPGADIERFRTAAAAALELPDVPLRDQSEDVKRVEHGTDLEMTALYLFAAAVAVAGVVLVGQSIARAIYAMAEPVPTLRAIGFTRGDLIAGMMWPAIVTAAASGLVATAAAIGLSPLFPVGLAGRLEPDPGFHLDIASVAVGVVTVAFLVGAAGLYAAGRSVLTSRRAGSVHDTLVSRLLRSRAPLPAMIGARLALQRGSGERALPVRPALVGSIAGVFGIIGAFGLLRGIDDALAEPERSGQIWDAEMYQTDTHSLEDLVSTAEADPGVAVAAIQRRTYVEVSGSTIPIHASREGYVVIDGRPPERGGEIALGPATARALEVDVGDSVDVSGRMTSVVGVALLPQSAHTSFDQGAWMTREGLHAAAPQPEPFDETVLVRFTGGADVAAATERLRESLGPAADVSTFGLPQDVSYLRNVRVLPLALAGFLAALGLGTLAHALISAVRRRRRDLAVLRAIGLRPTQTAGCLLWQAVVVVSVGLAGGIPLGVAAGRSSWRWIADATPLLYVPPVAVMVVLVLIPTCLSASQLVAALPSRRAACVRPAEVLRAE